MTRARTRSDGPVSDLSVGLTFAVSPTLQANFRTGWERARTELETLRNRTLWTSLGASIALPRFQRLGNADGALDRRQGSWNSSVKCRGRITAQGRDPVDPSFGAQA